VEQATQAVKKQTAARLEAAQKKLETKRAQVEKEKTAFEAEMQHKVSSVEKDLETFIAAKEGLLASIQGRIDRAKEQTADAQEDWNKQVEEMESEHSHNVQEIVLRQQKEDRYFEAKITALRAELAQVLKENEAIENDIKEDDADDENDEVPDRERLLSNKLSDQKQQEIDELVQQKIAELREKHRQERVALMLEAENLEQTAASLQEHAAQAEPEQWREAFFEETKNLKQEEAVERQRLDASKAELAKTMNRTAELRLELSKASTKYDAELAALRAQGDGHLENLRKVVNAKEKEVAQLQRTVEEHEQQVREQVRAVDDAENRLRELRRHLAQEKLTIKIALQSEFQPKIKEEREKTKNVRSEMSALRKQLEMSVVLMKTQLFDVETSTAALEATLAKETAVLSEELRHELASKAQAEERQLVIRLKNEEKQEVESLHELEHELAKEEETALAREKKKLEDYIAQREEKVAQLNNECVAVMAANSEKKAELKARIRDGCTTCAVLDKNLRKLEKLLVKMQLQDRELALDGANKRDMIHKLHAKSRLPPLPAQPL
jgi:hypothetical protein